MPAARPGGVYRELAGLANADPFGVLLVVPKEVYATSTRVQGFSPRVDQALLLYNTRLAQLLQPAPRRSEGPGHSLPAAGARKCNSCPIASGG